MIKKSKKEDANKKASMVLTGIIIFLLGLIFGVLIRGVMSNKNTDNKKEEKENVISIYDIDPIIKDYVTLKDRNVYLYNTNEVMIKSDDKDITLKEYINKYTDLDKMIDSIKDSLNVVNTLQDGGTTIYETKDDNKLFNKKLTIIKCSTSEGNKDMYVGEYVSTLKAFQNGACGKNYFSDKEFERVYEITKIKEVKKDVENDKYYLEITVKDENNKEVTINRVLNKESKEVLKEKTKYTFYFSNKYGELIKEDIEDIFNKGTLKGVVKVK